MAPELVVSEHAEGRRNRKLIDDLNELAASYAAQETEANAASMRTRFALYGWMRPVFGLLLELTTSDEAWEELKQLPLWPESRIAPTDANRSLAAFWVVLAILKPTTRRQRQTASKYASALEQLAFMQTPFAGVVQAIEDAGGVDALVRMAARRRRGISRAEIAVLRVRCCPADCVAIETLDLGSIVAAEVHVRPGQRGRREIFLSLSPTSALA